MIIREDVKPVERARRERELDGPTRDALRRQDDRVATLAEALALAEGETATWEACYQKGRALSLDPNGESPTRMSWMLAGARAVLGRLREEHARAAKLASEARAAALAGRWRAGAL